MTDQSVPGGGGAEFVKAFLLGRAGRDVVRMRRQLDPLEHRIALLKGKRLRLFFRFRADDEHRRALLQQTRLRLADAVALTRRFPGIRPVVEPVRIGIDQAHAAVLIGPPVGISYW